MTSFKVVLWHEYHSYPPLADGYYSGYLTLEEAGMIFRGDNGEQVIIPWDHLVSTYPDTRIARDPVLWLLWAEFWTLVFLPMMLFRHPRIGYVSVKWRDIEYDKLCVVEFAVAPDKSKLGLENAWANAQALDYAIWSARKSYRGDIQSVTMPLDLSHTG